MASPRICSVDGCGKRRFGYGFCCNHYRRWKLYGDPLKGRAPNGDRIRYLRQVVLQYGGDDCLVWPYARLTQNGYGVMKWEGRQQPVHRVVCQIIHGAAPSPKHQAAHLCGKGHEGCCTPSHIVWKTPSENLADKVIHGTDNRGERSPWAKLTESDIREIRAARGTITAEVAGCAVWRQFRNDQQNMASREMGLAGMRGQCWIR
jgi:hypothetical protein